jgi:hypothetical protein
MNDTMAPIAVAVHRLQSGLLRASVHVKVLGIGLHHTTIHSSIHAHGIGKHGRIAVATRIDKWRSPQKRTDALWIRHLSSHVCVVPDRKDFDWRWRSHAAGDAARGTRLVQLVLLAFLRDIPAQQNAADAAQRAKYCACVHDKKQSTF